MTKKNAASGDLALFVATSEVYCDALDRTHINGVTPKPFSVATVESALEEVIGDLS